MLPEKKLNSNKIHQQKSGQTPRRRRAQGKANQGSKFVTVIHPEKLKAITTTEENSDRFSAEKGADRASLVSWLFLVGSLMFLFDGLV